MFTSALSTGPERCPVLAQVARVSGPVAQAASWVLMWGWAALAVTQYQSPLLGSGSCRVSTRLASPQEKKKIIKKILLGPEPKAVEMGLACPADSVIQHQ